MPEPDNMERLMLTDDPAFDRVMECVFGIQPHESNTYRVLLERPGSTVAELASELDRDRSNVHRSLTTLDEKDIVRRERRLLEGGGYVYQYFAEPVAEVKARMHDGVDDWTEQVHGLIDSFHV